MNSRNNHIHLTWSTSHLDPGLASRILAWEFGSVIRDWHTMLKIQWTWEQKKPQTRYNLKFLNAHIHINIYPFTTVTNINTTQRFPIVICSYSCSFFVIEPHNISGNAHTTYYPFAFNSDIYIGVYINTIPRVHIYFSLVSTFKFQKLSRRFS